MPHILIVAHDPVAFETIGHQLGLRGYAIATATSPEAALDHIDGKGRALCGLIIQIDPRDASGWAIARRMREVNPTAAIGYLFPLRHHDWAINGVPGSMLIGSPGGEHDIPEDFFRLLYAADRGLQTREGDNSHNLADTIRRERDMLQDHFQRTPSFIAFLEGADHRYSFANAAYVRLVEREVVGRTVVEAFPEAVAQGFVDILDRVYRSGEDFVAHAVEFRINLSDAETKTVYIDLIYRPMRDADGDICGIFVEGEDLTTALETRERIAVLQNELIHIARINAMGMLASTLAHELTQPLASTQNFVAAATILARQIPPQPRLLECLEKASQNALRAGEIIRRLRAMTARRSIQREAVALEPVLREAIGTACTGRFDVDISYDFRSTSLVRADAVQLQQVMLNLVRNALEACAAEAPCLSISTNDDDAYVRTCLRDSGPGIPEAMLSRLFETFATTKSDGMGVGLSLCKTIIESHGGALTAQNNRNGEGATFCFTLPRLMMA